MSLLLKIKLQLQYGKIAKVLKPNKTVSITVHTQLDGWLVSIDFFQKLARIDQYLLLIMTKPKK